MRVVAVVPAYNESQVIGAVVKELRPFVDVVIVVDDGSTDGTGVIAASTGIVVLRHFLNRGQGAALQTGITYALESGADFIVTFDADGQHRADDVPRLIEPLLLNRFDVTLGSRFLPGATVADMPAVRRLVLKLAAWFDRARTGLRITDTHNGLRAFNRHAANFIRIRQDGMAHASEILDLVGRGKLRYTEIPVRVRYTEYTKGKGQRLRNGFSVLRDIVLQKLSKN